MYLTDRSNGWESRNGMNYNCIYYFVFFVVSGSCEIQEWSARLSSLGWSNCNSTSPYIKGLYRSNSSDAASDRLHRIKKVNCCAAIENVTSGCVVEDWLTSFDK